MAIEGAAQRETDAKRAAEERLRNRDFKTTLIYADYAPSEHEAEWVEEAFRAATPAAEHPTTRKWYNEVAFCEG